MMTFTPGMQKKGLMATRDFVVEGELYKSVMGLRQDKETAWWLQGCSFTSRPEKKVNILQYFLPKLFLYVQAFTQP